MIYRLALSSTRLIQAESASPAFAAAREYRSFRSVDTRRSIRSFSGFSIGGRPLGRLASMAVIKAHTNNP